MRLTNRRDFLKLSLGLAAGCQFPQRGAGAQAASLLFEPEKPIIPAPQDPAQWPEFRRRLADWRESRRHELNYSDALYDRPEFRWVTENFSCCFLMMCDETFYDPKAGRYTVAKFLDEGRREFGGYDSVVLWHAYPRIGLDERNQFDFYRDMPGGLKGVRAVSDEFHRAGVKVFLDYNPWDTGTRREGQSDLEALCDMVRELDADGIFLDTMDRGGAEFRVRLDAARPGVALESEGALPLSCVHDHHFSWAQWFGDSQTPGVLRNKWFEPRHLQHQIKRWDYDHTGELQSAWMNGSGMMVWENVFGSWVDWSPRDRSFLRLMLPVQRRFARVLCGNRWTPLVPTRHPDVYASLWEENSLKLWTLVNRSTGPVNGEVIAIEVSPEARVFDLMTGQELKNPVGEKGTIAPARDGMMNCALRLPPRGLGGLLAIPPHLHNPALVTFLAGQQALAERVSLDSGHAALTTQLKPALPSRKLQSVPAEMSEIPAAAFEMVTEMRERECGFYGSTPPDKHQLASSHEFRVLRVARPVTFRRFAVDLTPVTNAEFARFLKASGYRPRHPENFLKHWKDNTPPQGREDHPVVHVDLEDARAYAAWAGKRLPTEEEWQYAAQGTDGRRYPWGAEMASGRCNSGATGGTTPVKAFPAGRSPFGVYDLCGNVWEWTESERTDGRTRFAILKGGAFFTARGSGWYMNGGPRPANFSAKMLLMWPGLDRCSTVGFRCAADLE